MSILDSTVRREAQLLRFGTFLKQEYITPAFQELSKELPKIIAGYDELNKAGRAKVSREVNLFVRTRMSVMFESITSELHSMTDDEAEFLHELYDDFAPEVIAPLAVGAVISAADNAIISLTGRGVTQSGLWSEFIDRNIDNAARMVDGVVRQGMRDGVSLQQMTQELRGPYNRQTKKYMGGILNGRAAAQAESLVRTGISHYAHQAREKFAQANSDVIERAIFFATLDNRTTTICLRLNGREYKLGEKRPILPLHFGERSVYIYATEGFDPLRDTRPVTSGRKGTEAKERFEARQDRTDRKVKYKGRKDSDIFNVEMISGKMATQKWLENQPRWFVESSLGKAKAKLFLDGKLPIDKFTDLQGRPLSLAELRETAAGERAFRRAGL